MHDPLYTVAIGVCSDVLMTDTAPRSATRTSIKHIHKDAVEPRGRVGENTQLY